MIRARVLTMVASAVLLGSLMACRGPTVRTTCDEPQAYQSVVGGKRIVVPDDLDPLDDFKEMPIPKAETPPRPEGSKCIESPPSVLTGGVLG